MLNDGMKTSNSAEWATPQDFYDKLNEEFHFTLDPCSTDENAKCKKHYTKEQDGLLQDWTGETVFCNPPYGKGIQAWCKKCYEHSLHGGGWQSCWFMQEQIPYGSTTGFTERRKCVLCGEGCISMEVNGTRLFRRWWPFTDRQINNRRRRKRFRNLQDVGERDCAAVRGGRDRTDREGTAEKLR